jgi:calcineurin-like phosphoesterase family protein
MHYPIVEWNAYHNGAWHIYGHIHNRRDDTYQFMKMKKHALNAGCMINGYAPASLKELIRNNERFQMGDKHSER